MSKNPGRPGPRGLSADTIVQAAVTVMEEAGADGFSVRKVGTRVGCDPMAVLYHFKSRAGLERAMADLLTAEIEAAPADQPWRDRLTHWAHQYRALALRYPQTFPLLLRFWVTGPADYRNAEMVYGALVDAGFENERLVDVCFGLYANILGLAAAEAGGLLRPAAADYLAEVRILPPEAFPITTRLLPQFAAQQPGRVYSLMVQILLDGIARASPQSDEKRPAL